MVKDIFESTKEEYGKKAQLLISFGFLLLNGVLCYLILFLDIASWYEIPTFVIWAVLTVIYLKSASVISRKLNLARTAILQLGGIGALLIPLVPVISEYILWEVSIDFFAIVDIISLYPISLQFCMVLFGIPLAISTIILAVFRKIRSMNEVNKNYICEISDVADRETFERTVSELKKLYTDCSEIYSNTENTDGGTVILERSNGIKIGVVNDIGASRVYVQSSGYLTEYFDGKTSEMVDVEKNRHEKDLKAVLGVGFGMLNIITIYYSMAKGIVLPLIVAISAMAAYILSYWLLLNKINAGILSAVKVWLGGWILMPLTIFLLLILLPSKIFMETLFYKSILLPLILSIVIVAVYRIVKAKRGKEKCTDTNV